MKNIVPLLAVASTALVACQNSASHQPATASAQQQLAPAVIGLGQVPDLAVSDSTVHVAWGKGDSILYAFSSDGGNSFSDPEVVDVVSGLFSFAMRGPQIASVSNGAAIIACNQEGNLQAYQKTGSGKWNKTARVNDVDTIAKEGFLDLCSDGEQNLFAAWLDLRKGGHNNIVGARSADGGKTWSANRLLYQSPEGHVCECCKPSVAMAKNRVGVMFRNLLNGHRDLWLIQSSDGGETFKPAEKLGHGSWKLDGCPMDGGGFTLDENGRIQTVWRRKDTVYTASPGEAETPIATGKNCTMTTVNGKAVYAWVEKDNLVFLNPEGRKHSIGKGSLPVLRAAGPNRVLCIWDQDKKIQKAFVEL
jgi:hypothetical protein